MTTRCLAGYGHRIPHTPFGTPSLGGQATAERGMISTRSTRAVGDTRGECRVELRHRSVASPKGTRFDYNVCFQLSIHLMV